MAGVRFYLALALILMLWTRAATAENPQNLPQLYDRPELVVDAGMHMNTISGASADRDGHWAVTGSQDKTVRVWSLGEGKLERTIRIPAGPGNVGIIYDVAMSPDGALIAAGGWTVGSQGGSSVYLFDRSSGQLVRRIEGLPNVANYVAFSSDGDRLAVLLSVGGLRIYAKERDWDEVARDPDYRAIGYGADFAPDGRLATTSFDGKLRLYGPDLRGIVRPIVTVDAPGGDRPRTIAFSPTDGARVAVGYNRNGRMDLLDGHTLAALPGPNLSGVEDTSVLPVVAWSRDGRTLLAGGLGYPDDQVFAFGEAGVGQRRYLYVAGSTVFALVALPGGDLLAAEAHRLVRLSSDGATRWAREVPVVDFGGQFDRLAVSSDGLRVEFGYKVGGGIRARFDVASLTLVLPPSGDGEMAVPRQTGLNIDLGDVNYFATLDGKTLSGKPYEDLVSLAIHPSSQSFVLGTSFEIRAYDFRGAVLWGRPAHGEVWAVNIAGDGRLVIAAYGDGTIRWHRMTDGTELLAFMPLPDRTNWVAWTPEGFYAASAGAQGVLRWHVNRGLDPADSVAVEDIPGSYRPEVLRLVLEQLETPRALGLADMAEHDRQVMLRTHSHIPAGARLHLLTIGINQYNEEYAKNLRLQFADRDARDLASAIINTQAALYQVKPTVLLDRDANKTGILRALKNIRAAMEAGTGNDLAVIHFSGHGALVDQKLFLLPYDVDARDDAGIESNGLSVEELRGELAELGRHGRVLVLLDACHSGATTTDGSPLSMDSSALRTALAVANVSVLTSSSGPEVSYETPELQHGAFTKALLDAFDDPEADVNRNGLITPTGLAAFVENRVPMLTGDKQHPGMEVRYDTTLFARSR